MMRNKTATLCLLSIMGACSMGYAQYTGKVGINTDKPTQTLDVSGTTRVRELLTSETDSNGIKLKGFTYNVVATENGTLGKQKISKKTWNLYGSSFNVRQNVSEILPLTYQTTLHYTAPENTWEIPNSDMIIEVPNIDNTDVFTKLSWSTWFEIHPREIEPLTDNGSFRFYIKYIEVDTDGNVVAGATEQYTKTIFMTSFINLNKATTIKYRLGMSPSYAEKDETFFKKGKSYKVSLVVALESMREGSSLKIENWGIDAMGDTYFQDK